MNRIFVATGSNIGDRKMALEEAIQQIEQQIGRVVALSGVYQTAAWGGLPQADYYNQVLQVETEQGAEEVLRKCLAIESEMGRERKERWGARKIDIDLLFYENEIIETPFLTLPHPRLHLRNFVLLPMQELAPNWIHPIFKKNIEVLLEECLDDLNAKLIE